MTIDEFANQVERLHRRYTDLTQRFLEFREDIADYFDGTPGAQRIPEVRVIRPADANTTEFTLTFLGRSFTVKFSPQVEDNDTIGKLSVFEVDDTDPAKRIKRPECHFTRNGTVTDVQGFDHDGDPFQIGIDRPSNIYLTLHLACNAVSHRP